MTPATVTDLKLTALAVVEATQLADDQETAHRLRTPLAPLARSDAATLVTLLGHVIVELAHATGVDLPATIAATRARDLRQAP